MFGGGKFAVFDGGGVFFDGVQDAAAVHKIADEPFIAGCNAEHVVCDEDLSVASGAGADSDGRDMERLTDFGGEFGGGEFEDEHGRPGVLECEGVVFDAIGVIAASLHFVSALCADPLGGESGVCADGDSALDEKLDGFGEESAAFDFDHCGAGGGEFCGVLEGVLRGGLKRAEGHVSDDDGVWRSGADAADVVGGIGGFNGEGILRALDEHAERVADEECVGAAFVEDVGEGGVVGGEHGDFFALGFHAEELGEFGMLHGALIVAGIGFFGGVFFFAFGRFLLFCAGILCYNGGYAVF